LTFVGTTQNAALGFGLTFTYGVGVGLPFWLVAGFSMSLPKAGAWMEAVKSVFGIVLLVAALYYLKNIFPALARLTSPSPAFLGAAAGAIALGVALGAVHLSFHDRASARGRKALGVALTVVGLFLAINWLLTPRGRITLTWLQDEASALAEARRTGRPVFMDFYATWCVPCDEMAVTVFTRPEIAAELQELILLKYDTSKEFDDPAIPETKKRYNAGQLPAYRILAPDGRVLAAANGLMPADRFLEFLRQGRALNPP
jgi:thiol:disulfide interchange protein DsbD